MRGGILRFVTKWWPPLVAAAATIGYAVAVLGFGLDFRPLQNDEGVTLAVASMDSVREVLHTAIDVRHGPPLHYLLVHASLAWRDDILGLRLPSAVLGILAVAISYGTGRELLGRSGGAIVSVIVATSPITLHLGQFARGYTAMMAAAFASLWLLLILVRTRRLRWVVPYALSALLLVAAHPFGLFALASEVVLLIVMGVGPKLRHPKSLRADWRSYLAVAVAALLAVAAMVVLRWVYAPLQTKYGVGSGASVVDLGSSGFWSRLGDHVSGSGDALAAIALGAAAIAGFVALLSTNRRAALVVGVWIGLPVGLLIVFTASSHDFAPERHLSFLMPGYATAVAAFVLELGRRLPRKLAPVAAVVLGALLITGLVADVRIVGGFNDGLRNASLELGRQHAHQRLHVERRAGDEQRHQHAGHARRHGQQDQHRIDRTIGTARRGSDTAARARASGRGRSSETTPACPCTMPRIVDPDAGGQRRVGEHAADAGRQPRRDPRRPG